MNQTIDNKALCLEAGEHAVLLIHGLCANTVEVERLAHYLHASGISIFAPNISGYCYGMPASDWQHWLATAHGHFHDLKQRYRTVSVAGVSMGATLALALAEEVQPDGLVLLSTALAYDGWAMPWYRFLMNCLPIVPFKHRYSYRESEPYGIKNPRIRALIKKALQSGAVSEVGGASISLRHLVEARRMIKYVRKHIEQASCPVLIMHAVDDETVSINNAEWVLQHIGSSNKDMIYLGNCYHMITVDNERDIVFHETERFIKNTINAALPAPSFVMPPLLSSELRRLLRQTDQDMTAEA